MVHDILSHKKHGPKSAMAPFSIKSKKLITNNNNNKTISLLAVEFVQNWQKQYVSFGTTAQYCMSHHLSNLAASFSINWQIRLLLTDHYRTELDINAIVNIFISLEVHQSNNSALNY